MKGQSAVESAMIISFMFLIFTAFLVLVSKRYVDVQEEKDRMLIEDISDVIQNEIDMALLAENGYYRQFSLPVKLGWKNYSINLTPSYIMKSNFSELSIKYINRTKKFEHAIFLPKNVNGTIINGKNYVTKRNGMICLNKGACL